MEEGGGWVTPPKQHFSFLGQIAVTNLKQNEAQTACGG